MAGASRRAERSPGGGDVEGPAPRYPLLDALRWAGLLLGPCLALLVYALLPEASGGAVPGDGGGLTQAGRATAAMAAWMALWWLTEAVPLAATSLLPLVLVPLWGAGTMAEATAPYSRSAIFLFMGGFILGLGMQRSGLHRRIALVTVLRVGTDGDRLIGGFMLATAALSMWLSNTATVIMLLPIGASILAMFEARAGDARDEVAPFGTALMLGIAYAASIGGIGTLIGTPPNVVLASFVEQHYGIRITMLGWMRVGLPLVVLFLPLAWLYLTRVACPAGRIAITGGREIVRAELKDLGPMQRGERVVLVVFLATALGWVLRPQIVRWTGLTALDDAVIAMTGALLLFVIPVRPAAREFAMDWETARQLPWGILILFGGGLSLASAITRNGVDVYLASGFGELAGVPTIVFLLAIISVAILLTEITSNTAVATTLMPVLAATATATGMPPGLLLLSATLAASCAFMLPVATPPNAIVFSSGYVTIPQMVRIGLGLEVIGIVLITLLVWLTGPVLIAG